MPLFFWICLQSSTLLTIKYCGLVLNRPRYHSECVLMVSVVPYWSYSSCLVWRSGVVISFCYMWCPSRIGYGAFAVLHLYLTFWSGHQKALSQLSFVCDPFEAHSALTRPSNCLSDIRDCIARDFLELNGDKTELVLEGNPERLSNIHDFEHSIVNATGKPAVWVRHLGVYFDSPLSANWLHKRLLSRLNTTSGH